MDQHNLNLTALPASVCGPAETFATTLIAEIADNLRSISVVGSSLTEDFRPGHSDINTVVVLGERTLAALNSIAALARPMSKKKIASPLLMTLSYIERSLDVFGVEFLDFQLTHQTILGDDPFAALAFEKMDVRLQCERELKATLIRLRQGYITTSANRRVVQDILISTVKGLAPIFRAMFWLKGVERPNTAEPTIRKATEVFSLNTDAIARAETWRRQKTRIDEEQMQETFEAIYTTVEQLSVIVDELQL